MHGDDVELGAGGAPAEGANETGAVAAGAQGSKRFEEMYVPFRGYVLSACFVVAIVCTLQQGAVRGCAMLLMKDENAPYFKEVMYKVTSAFYIGHVVTPVISALVLIRTGRSREMVTIAALLAGVACAALPAIFPAGVTAAQYGAGFVGAMHAVQYVGCFSLVTRWIPAQEHTRAFAFLLIGTYLGALMAQSASHGFSVAYSYPTVFHVYGSLSIVSAAAFAFVVRNSPREHQQKLRASEFSYIQSNALIQTVNEISILSIAKLQSVWVSVAVAILVYTSHVGLFTSIPYLMVECTGFDTSFLFWIIILFAVYATAVATDLYLKKLRVKSNASRGDSGENSLRFAMTLCGLIGGAIFVLFARRTFPPLVRIVALLFAILYENGVCINLLSNMTQISTSQSPMIFATFLTIGSLPAMVMEGFVPFILDISGSWSIVTLSICIPLSVAALVWGLWGNARRSFATLSPRFPC